MQAECLKPPCRRGDGLLFLQFRTWAAGSKRRILYHRRVERRAEGPQKGSADSDVEVAYFEFRLSGTLDSLAVNSQTVTSFADHDTKRLSNHETALFENRDAHNA